MVFALGALRVVGAKVLDHKRISTATMQFDLTSANLLKAIRFLAAPKRPKRNRNRLDDIESQKEHIRRTMDGSNPAPTAKRAAIPTLQDHAF